MLAAGQKEARKAHIGASEIPALFGEHIKLTGSDLWLLKAFGEDEKEIGGNTIEMGDDFETPLLKYAARELGVEIDTDPDHLFKVCEAHPILSATCDALIVPDRGKQFTEAIEAKTTSLDGSDFGGKDNEWGEKDTDQIPTRVILQCQAQMCCHGLERVHVVVLMGRMGLRRELYRVERNQKIIDAIIKKSEDFWTRYVVPKLQPPPEEFGLGSIDIIKRVVRQPTTWAEVPDDYVAAWETARKTRLDAEKAEKEALERMLTPLGDAEGAQLPSGRILTYFPTTKTIVDQKRLKAEYPEIYSAVLKESTSRTARIKGA
jgi:predicted phage-related endonuclease